MKKFVAVSASLIVAAGALAPLTNLNVEAASKPTTITFWHAMTGNNEKVLEKLVKKFNNSQDKYVVKPTAQGDYSTLKQKFLAAAKSKKLPVVAQSAYTSVPDYVKNNLIANLNKYVKQDNNKGVKAINKMYKGFRTTAKYQGKYYTVPFAKSLRIMLYNQDILDKYNLSVPKTWNDLQADAKILSKDGIAAVGFDQSFGQELQNLAKSNGVNFVDGSSNKFKVHFNDKKVIEPADLIMNMINNKEALTAGADVYGNNNFASGKTLVYFASSSGLPVISASMPENMNWKTAVVPSYKDKINTLIGGSDLIVSNQASDKQKTGAWKFMQFLISKKSTTEWAKGTGYLPLTSKAVETTEYQEFLNANPNWKASSDSLKYAFSSPIYPNADAIWNIGIDAVDSMLSQKVEPKVALDKIQKEAKKLIKEASEN
ncbi:MAG: ABC transporter substrate-binding protein [Lactobacillaceae bacterium]|jgi:multiple sugar transport system substrate-binding protein|nr:ABC transporter substrate-binding protein [Lactobacillaceae bacterium]